MALPPKRRAFLTAEWRHLVMLNYEVAPEVLYPLVPTGTTLDLHEDRALISVVGFRFLRTRMLGMAIPFHCNFDEVNLRFYVRRDLPNGEIRRGVTFVRELVPRAAISFIARLAYNEPYRTVRMRSSTPATNVESPERIMYAWRTGARWQHLAATAVGIPSVPSPSSEAAFITEHYWGYTPQQDGSTLEYEVEHSPWRVWMATASELTADIVDLYGSTFEPGLLRPPVSAFVADGSAVVVYRPHRITTLSKDNSGV